MEENTHLINKEEYLNLKKRCLNLGKTIKDMILKIHNDPNYIK